MSDLKPCPFCGGEDSVELAEICCSEQFYYVECMNCGVRTDGYLDPQQPALDWNTRHSDPDMVLVPREPTEGMTEKAWRCHHESRDYNSFRHQYAFEYKQVIQAWEKENE